MQIHLHIYLCIIYISIHLSIYLSIYLSILDVSLNLLNGKIQMETLCTLNQKSKLNHIYTYIYIIYIYYTYIYKYHIYIYIYIYIYIHNFETTICIHIYIDNFKKFKRVINFFFLFIEVHYRNKTEFKKTEKF